MDLNNADDLRLIKEYFASKDKETCDGMPVQIAAWHK